MATPVQQESPRLRALKNLANQLPVANQQIAAGQQAARDIQLQQAVRAAPAATPIGQTGQTTGAAIAQQAGQQAAQRAQQQAQQGGQIGQIGLQAQGQEAEARIAGQSSGLREQKMNNVQRLAQLDERAKRELFDAQMQFRKDEAGRTLFNEEQLADYAVANAKSDQDLQNYMSRAKLANERSMQMMEAAYKKVAQDLDFKYQKAKQTGDQQAMIEIANMKKDMELKKQKYSNRASNKSSMYGAIGTVAGAIIGGYVTESPYGAAVGAGIGGAAGEGAAASTT